MAELGGFLFLLTLIAIGLVVVVGAVVLVVKLLQGGAPVEVDAEYKKLELLSAAEKVFFRALLEGAGEGELVLAKVRLADVIGPKISRSEGKEWRQAFNQIQSKHLDFLVCDAGSLDVICAIELDDKSHQRADRVKRDGIVDKALAGAGVPLVRFAVARHYKTSEITDKIRAAIQPPAIGGEKSSFRLT